MATEIPLQLTERDRLPMVNDEIASQENRYRLIQILGDGGYGTVFLSKNTQKNVAVKTEKYSKSMLHIEVNVLKAANAALCKHFCQLHDFGTCKPDYVYLVMTLLYKDLHKLRSEQPEKKFGFSTSLRVAIQTFNAIEELHMIGYISRDIKPGNFAPGHKATKQGRTIFMYDFGLARRFVDDNRNLIPSRNEVGWRGTTRYGSLFAHKKMAIFRLADLFENHSVSMVFIFHDDKTKMLAKRRLHLAREADGVFNKILVHLMDQLGFHSAKADLGRRDDIESWFYMVIELTKGRLPWRLISDRNQVFAAKLAAREGHDRKELLNDTHPQYNLLLTWIDSLVFEDTPPYLKFYNVLEAIREERKIRMHEHWDWEDETSPLTSISRSNSEI